MVSEPAADRAPLTRDAVVDTALGLLAEGGIEAVSFRRIAKALGVDPDIEFLGYEDGRLSETPLNELRERCMRAIRRLRPDVLFTWDPFAPYENHQDHRAVAWAAIDAASFSHFPLYHPEHRDEGLEPHYVGEQYFFAKVPYDVNKAVDISGHVERKIEALCQHPSQMELMVAELQVQLAASGLDLPPLRDADPKDYRPVIETMIRTWAAGVGRRHGAAFVPVPDTLQRDCLPQASDGTTHYHCHYH